MLGPSFCENDRGRVGDIDPTTYLEHREHSPTHGSGGPVSSPRDEVDDAALGKVLAFMRVLWSLDHALQTMSKRMAATLEVTGPQRLVLRLLGRQPGSSAGALADILKLHPSTLTGILRRLEERSLIVRDADPLDRRRAVLRLTAAGTRLNAERAGTIENAIRRALTKVSAAEIATTERVLSLVVRELEVDVGDATD